MEGNNLRNQIMKKECNNNDVKKDAIKECILNN
jgi:hypothetical protein